MNNDDGVIVVGSLHYDIILNATHQPSKGEIVVGHNWYPKFGGKGGNQAIAASSYGVPTKIIGAVGDDNFGKYILEKIKLNSTINTEFIQILSNQKSGMSVAISDKEGEYGAVIVSGANLAIDPEILNNSKVWDNSKILMLQNEVKEELNILAAKYAKTNGLKVCLNASPPKILSSELVFNTDILIVNLIEAEAISKTKLNKFNDAINLSKKLTEKFELVIITAGNKGVIGCQRNNEPFSLPAKNVPVASTHGAGDVFAGIFCAALASNEDFDKALKLANHKAAFHVSK